MAELDTPPDKDVPCAFCGVSVVGGTFVICSACDVPLHRDCWSVNGKCPAYACGSMTPLDPAIAHYRNPGTRCLVPGPGSDHAPVPVSETQRRIQLIEARLSAVSKRTIAKLGVLVGLTIALLLVFETWRTDAVIYAVTLAIGLIWGTSLAGSRSESREIRLLRRRLDELKTRELERQLEAHQDASG